MRQCVTIATMRVLLAGLLLAGGAGVAEAQIRGLRVGDRAPTAMVQTLDGRPVALDDYVGKGPLLIEFWATWCPLCRSMEPTFRDIDRKYGKDLRMLFLVVPTNQTPARAKEYVERVGHPGTFLFDADGSAYRAFAAYHTSYVLVLDRSGTVLYSADGGDQKLDDAIMRAIRK